MRNYDVVLRGVPQFGIKIGPMVDALTHLSPTTIFVGDYFDKRLLQLPNFHWIPVNEVGKSWGYLPFFAFKHLLDFSVQEYDSTYVCCIDGTHCSPMMVFCWLLSLGYSQEVANNLFVGEIPDMILQYQYDVAYNHIPQNLILFYKEIHSHPTLCYQDILSKMGIYEIVSYAPSLIETLSTI